MLKPSDVTEAHITLQLFPGYTQSDSQILYEFANSDARPERGFVVDFLGSRIRTTSLWQHARALDGQVLGIPDPADFHAEAIEWIGLLKAVRTASGQYAAMELGAGFGPWSVAGALAARRLGIKKIRLYAVEADAEHFQFLRQHFADNGLDPNEHALFEAAVGVSAGVAHWPVVENPAEDWGSRPIHNTGEFTDRALEATKDVRVVSMAELIRQEPLWNLVHIDVQGDEVDICSSCLRDLSSRVRWLVVGTHSRKIDGDLLNLMGGAGWLLEHEKPTKFAFVPNAATLEAMTTLDGTQVWRNPRLDQGVSFTLFSQEMSSDAQDLRVKPGADYTLDVIVKNTGTQPWFRDRPAAPVNLSYRWYEAKGSMLAIEGNRAFLSAPVLQPGQTDRFSLRVTAPPLPGFYMLRLSMVQEGVSWFFNRGAKPLDLRVTVD
jgi:FkbM family methyltransferase